MSADVDPTIEEAAIAAVEPDAPVDAEERDPLTYHSFFHTQDPKRLRRLPSLAKAALGIVWRAARKELLVSAACQLIVAVGVAVQLLVVRQLLSELLGSDGGVEFSNVVPEMVLMAAVSAAIALAGVFNDARNASWASSSRSTPTRRSSARQRASTW